MTSVPSPPLPPDVSASACTFPEMLLGHWHHTYVADNTIVFKVRPHSSPDVYVIFQERKLFILVLQEGVGEAFSVTP